MPNSTQLLIEKIHKLLAMKDKGSALGRNGFDFVQRSLKKDEIVGQIETCLLQAVALLADYSL